jgi:hypothetical protein
MRFVTSTQQDLEITRLFARAGKPRPAKEFVFVPGMFWTAQLAAAINAGTLEFAAGPSGRVFRRINPISWPTFLVERLEARASAGFFVAGAGA